MRHATHATIALGILGLVLLGACGGGGGSGDAFVVRAVPPGPGVRIQQVDFLYPQGAHLDSTWGVMVVDPAALSQSTGIQRGFLNVAHGEDWVLVNAPVLASTEPAYALYFDLGLAQPQDLTAIELHVLHSNRGIGKVEPHLGQSATYPVDRAEFAAEQYVPGVDPGAPPVRRTIFMEVVAPRDVTTRTQVVTNVQCAHNQCMTMAVANALQYLEDMGVIDLPHDHDPGQFGDATLVGQLDDHCGRGGTSRTVGNGLGVTAMVDGTFEYVADESLLGMLDFRHENDGVGWTVLGTGTGDHDAFGSTSVDDGGTITWDYVWDRIGDGSGVVAVYQRDSGGGHAGRVTAAGFDDTGRRWIRFSHDRTQANADPTDTLGLENWVVDLADTDGDGYLNFSPTRELQFLWAFRAP